MGTDPGRILEAIRDLDASDVERRTEAREFLEQGDAAVGWHLLQVLVPVGPRTRAEALRLLGHRGDPAALPAFLEALEDDDPACRWHAAEGLASLGRPALERVLVELVNYPASELLLRGLHHALRALGQRGYSEVVEPVLAAFASPTPRTDVPAAAAHARHAVVPSFVRTEPHAVRKS